jgi:hypothetical protein
MIKKGRGSLTRTHVSKLNTTCYLFHHATMKNFQRIFLNTIKIYENSSCHSSNMAQFCCGAIVFLMFESHHQLQPNITWPYFIDITLFQQLKTTKVSSPSMMRQYKMILHWRFQAAQNSTFERTIYAPHANSKHILQIATLVANWIARSSSNTTPETSSAQTLQTWQLVPKVN